MASATRGSRRTLRSFWRPLAELKVTCSPSKSHHTGVTCGRPSGMRVPKLAKAFFWKRSRYFSGMTFDIAGSFLKLSLLDRSDYRCADAVSCNTVILTRLATGDSDWAFKLRPDIMFKFFFQNCCGAREGRGCALSNLRKTS